MVQDYIAKFGGTASDVNADVAEAYSAGEVLAAAVTATGSLKGSVIAQYLHTHTVQTARGPGHLQAADGENTDAVNSAFIFQWQNGHFFQVLPQPARSAGAGGAQAALVSRCGGRRAGVQSPHRGAQLTAG